ncbi:unnamed protein product, partial [Sphacelaria rigidula]
WWDKHARADSKPGGVGLQGAKAPEEVRAKVLYNYTASDNTELSLVEGEVLTVVTQDPSGWWTGEKGGTKALFPSNYVRVM